VVYLKAIAIQHTIFVVVLHPVRNNSLRLQGFLLYSIRNGIGGCRYATLRCYPGR
jgi:hypothetical protein